MGATAATTTAADTVETTIGSEADCTRAVIDTLSLL
jgi:hypothetical protein